MKRILAAVATVGALSTTLAAAEQSRATPSHLVSLEAAQARLDETATEREGNLATIDAFATSPEGSAALAALGVDADRLRVALATLSDSELQELASRAAALDTDPVAGAFTRRQVVWIAAIALAVVILVAVVS